MTFNVELLNQQIAEGKEEEQNTKALFLHIESHLSRLHEAILISSDSPESILLNFADDYIQLAPDHLDALHHLAKDTDTKAFVQPFLNMAHTYFANPPEILEALGGLLGLLGRAYLCHRIMEEVNDLVMSGAGCALSPGDMSMANIVAHSLLGDELANQLDHLVLLAIETSETDKSILKDDSIQEKLSLNHANDWQAVKEKWPCFAKNCAIDFQFGNGQV